MRFQIRNKLSKSSEAHQISIKKTTSKQRETPKVPRSYPRATPQRTKRTMAGYDFVVGH